MAVPSPPIHPAVPVLAASPLALAAVGVASALGVLGLWVMVTYNGLATRRVRVQNGFAQIDVQLRRRHDLVPNIVATVQGAMAHERQTLEAVTRARAAAVAAERLASGSGGRDASATGALAGAEGALAAALGRLMVVMERYPELKANASALQLQEELVSTENRIAFARQAYNDAVMTYNTRLAVFPDLVVARLLGFAPAALFEADEPSRALPVVDLGASRAD